MTEETKTYPPLTAEEFASGAGFSYRGVPIVEDEWATWVFTHGHVDKETFAEVVNDYDREMDGGAESGYTASDVQHLYAVTTEPPESDSGWIIRWGSADQQHADRFPVTVVSR